MLRSGEPAHLTPEYIRANDVYVAIEGGAGASNEGE
jgi:hypothetical protein